MPTSEPSSCTALFPSGGPSGQSDPLGPAFRDAAAQRLAGLAGILAITVVFVLVLQRVAQPQLTAVIDDPVNRLASLAAVLMAAGLLALHRTRTVSSHTLLLLGLPFEVVVALSISMIETSRPFDPAVPLLGMSAVGPWIVLVSAIVPKRPLVTLAVSLAAASMWPLAYWINSSRLGFPIGSLAQLSVWPTINYMLAGLAFLVGRSTYGTSRQAQAAEDLGSYRLELKIGEGGMGEVWRGSHKMLARPAAIKLVKAGEAAKEEVFTRRFRREANAIASLQSPHTVYLYDFGITRDGRLYYVMELLDGISLQTLITSFGPQPAARVIAILRQMCLSLEEAHELQLVHRDFETVQRHDLPRGATPRRREGPGLRPREVGRQQRLHTTDDGRGGHGHSGLHGAGSRTRQPHDSTGAPISTLSAASATSCSQGRSYFRTRIR